ncbi:peptidoglycan-binding protein, partial [Streptomyces sp. NPDC127079]
MSTPPDPEQARRGPVLEPVRVLRPRRLDALAELMREIREEAEADEKERTARGVGGPAGFEAFDSSPGRETEDETQELPPVTDGRGRGTSRAFGFGPGLRRAAVVVAVGAAALVGFGC